MERTHKLINLAFGLFILTTGLDYFKLGPFSLSMPLGIFFLFLICIYDPKLLTHIKNRNILILLFSIISLCSLLFSPVGFSPMLFLQIIYWFFLINAITNYFPQINFHQLKFWILVKIIIMAFVIMLMRQVTTENEASYMLICFWPFVLYAINRFWKKLFYVLFITIVVFLMGSRTGLGIVFIQIFLLLLINDKMNYKKFNRLIFIGLLSLIIITSSFVRKMIGNVVYQYDPLIAMVIVDPTILTMEDKSMAQRKIQIQKAKQIYKEYPLIGIGPESFKEYNININSNKIEGVDDTALNIEFGNSSNRASHNSYYMILSETGTLGFILFIFLLILIMKQIPKMFTVSKLAKLEYVSFVGFVINLYMVSSFWGSHSWALLGLYLGVCSNFIYYKNRVANNL